jgi:parvulin-like peptidyl-prolyl isomerase
VDEYIIRGRKTFGSFEEELAGRKDLLDTLIVQQLLIQEAYRMNIDESEEINRIVLANRDKFLLDILYKRIVLDYVNVTDDDIKDFYAKLEDKVKASHILLFNQDTALMIIDSLKNGANFENLAVNFSIDPSAKTNQGDLGYFVWGQMDDVFSENVFKMEPGEISEPFETRFGWHIVKMVDRAPNELRGTYDNMSDQIKRSLENALKIAKLDEYKNQLQEKYIVRVDTITCEYLMHKRANLYPPSLLKSLPKNDFDVAQLDRDEKELILANWAQGQITVGQYLARIKQYSNQRAPNFDDYEGLSNYIFQMNFMDILSVEARNIGLEDDAEYKKRIRKFRELAMADVMQNDSLQYPDEPDEGEMRQYYEDHPDEFIIPEKIHIYEIMFSSHNLAKTYALKVKSLGKFKTLAMEHTERVGKRKSGGDLGYIEERYYPMLFKSAKETNVGKVAGPINNKGKYSIIYIADKKPEQIKEFLMAKQDIMDTLEKQGHREAFEKWVENRKAEVNIKINENNIRAGIDKDKYAPPDTTSG